MITRFLTVVLILCGATLLLLSTATRMPILALVGGLCSVRRMGRIQAQGGDARRSLSVVAPDSRLSGDLVRWTMDRFTETPGPAGCRSFQH